MIPSNLLTSRSFQIRQSRPVGKTEADLIQEEQTNLLRQLVEQVAVLNKHFAAQSATQTIEAESNDNCEADVAEPVVLPKSAFDSVTVPRQLELTTEESTTDEVAPYTLRERILGIRIVQNILSWGCRKNHPRDHDTMKAFDADADNYMYAARKAMEQNVVSDVKYATAFYGMQNIDPTAAELFHLEWTTRQRVEGCPVHVCKHWFINGRVIGRQEGHAENRIGDAFRNFQNGEKRERCRFFERLNPYGVPFNLFK